MSSVVIARPCTVASTGRPLRRPASAARTCALGKWDWMTSIACDRISALASWIDCHDGSSVTGVMQTSAPAMRSWSVNGLSNGASTDMPKRSRGRRSTRRRT
jgi:hypothetical protein